MDKILKMYLRVRSGSRLVEAIKRSEDRDENKEYQEQYLKFEKRKMFTS